MASMRPYTAPPRGYHARWYVFFRLYKVFILYTRENVHSNISTLLWGSCMQRREVKGQLQRLNFYKFSRSSVGWIEVENWWNAGDQLEKAVRDYHIYGSTAYFKDVQDFIWECIHNIKYPSSWRNTAEHCIIIRKELLIDPYNSIFHNWVLDNLPGNPSDPLPPYRGNQHSTIPGYIFPPLGFCQSQETDSFTDKASLVPQHTRCNLEDTLYRIFIQNTE
ncbi:hypothetical protein BDW62DRAFT_209554 [Aspergillus aurantiobrunneus]